jgi:hypothetical protein
MKINTNKTEVMTISKDRLITNITINGDQLKQVEEFKYLESLLTYNNKQAAKTSIRCSKASQIIGQISTLISSKEISQEAKRAIYHNLYPNIMVSVSNLDTQC